MIHLPQWLDVHDVVPANRSHHEAEHAGQNRARSRQAQSNRRDDYCTERNEIHVSLPKNATVASLPPRERLRRVCAATSYPQLVRKLVQERSHIRWSLASRLLLNGQHRSRSTLGRRHHPTHSAGGTVRLPTRPTLNVIVSCDVCSGPFGRVPIDRVIALRHTMGLTWRPGTRSSRSARFSTQTGGGNQGINSHARGPS